MSPQASDEEYPTHPDDPCVSPDDPWHPGLELPWILTRVTRVYCALLKVPLWSASPCLSKWYWKWSSALSKLFLFYLFISGCAGSLLLCTGSLYLWRAGALLHCRARVSHCGGFSRCGAQARGHTGFSSCSSRALEPGSVVVVHGLSCPAACRIFPDQGSNLCPLHWQADS